MDSTALSVSPTPASAHDHHESHALQTKNNSLTPPPSSPQLNHGFASVSSSPTAETVLPSEDDIRRAQPDELRAMIAGLLPSLQEARTDATHYKLQYRMLAIESAETIERIQVEMDMAQREIDVLNTADIAEPRLVQVRQVRQTIDPNMRHVHTDIWNSMVQEIHGLKSQNVQLENLVSQHKKMVVQQESEIASLNDRVSLLRERLRENRHHLNRYRRAAGFQDSPHRSSSVQLSPWTPRQRHEPPFAALLHASDLMSERGTTSPQTPRRRREVPSTSTPLTPQTVQPRLSRDVYATPQTQQSLRHLQVPQTAPPLRRPLFQPTFSPQTGSSGAQAVPAADDSEAETEVPEQSTELVEDQAGLVESQLPRTPTRNRNEASTVARSNFVQGTLFRQVRKAGVQRDGNVMSKTSALDHASASGAARTETNGS